MIRLSSAFRLCLSSAVVLLAMSLMPQTAEAACGAKNQTPCKVWERIPSCDKGLKENFIKHQCVK